MNRFLFVVCFILLSVAPAIEAIADGHRALLLDPQEAQLALQVYRTKWQAMVNLPDFEVQEPSIRADIQTLLTIKPISLTVLEVVAFGYELLADESSLKLLEKRVLLEFPKSTWAQNIHAARALNEPNKLKQAAMLESFIARYPDDLRLHTIYSLLFRIRANQPDLPSDRLHGIGEAWCRVADHDAYDAIKTRITVALVLAEKRIHLERAEAIAVTAVKLVGELMQTPALLAGTRPADRLRVIDDLNGQAQAAMGFIYLRQGRINEAATKLSGPLQPVSKQVERDGYILWKDADLREFGLRTRVLWLAELFEAQGDYQRAAKYLLAGASDDERNNRLIQTRLPAVYAKLGRSEREATASFNQAVQRYRALTTPTLAMRDEEKRRLLALRTDMPAPDFKAMRLDKQEIRLADFKGKVAVLIFWATWCGPCVAEMPYFQEAVKKYAANQDVTFLAISIDERKLAVRPFIEGNHYRLPVAYDINGAAALSINAVPSLLIVDRQGRVAFREQGFGGEADHYVERLSWRIDELLKESTRMTNE
jgi:thiol-disulfide isomerase/thioredoxin